MGCGKWAACILAITVVLSASQAEELEVPLSVAEPLGIARTNQPVSGGIPFKPGVVRNVGDLMLFDANGKAVPAQFTKLAGYEDGSVQWALVDLLTDLAAGGKRSFVLKTAPAKVGPPMPLAITETSSHVAVDTGPLSFKVSKVKFALLEEVKVEGKPVAEKGAVILIDDAGKSYTASKVTKASWEYRGPIRATLRIDGSYVGSNGAKGLDFTTRITAWAGLSAVRIQHSIRNSEPKVGNDAAIKQAELSLELAFTASDQGKADHWAAGGNGKVGLLLTTRHTAGLFPGPPTYLRKDFGCGYSKEWPVPRRQQVAGNKAVGTIVTKWQPTKRGEFGYDETGEVWHLADCAHKASEVWLDFYKGRRSAKANEQHALALRSRLLLVAPGEYYSESEALGIGHFGTLADEIATYKKWGWKGWDDPEKRLKLVPNPFAFVPYEAIHDVSEDDAVEGYLLQYLRTGERGWFDWAAAWADYYRGHAIRRFDGWQYDGCFSPRSGIKKKSTRQCKGLGHGWYGPKEYGWSDSRMHYCHQYGRGIFDYYCITGEVDALEAGLDQAEFVLKDYDDAKPGGSFGLGRSYGRAFLTVLRAYQLAREPKWKKGCQLLADLALKADNFDETVGFYRTHQGYGGFYFIREWLHPRPRYEGVLAPRLANYYKEHGLTAERVRDRTMATDKDGNSWEVVARPQVFELSACHMAMDRYARLFDSDPMRGRLVAIARGVRDHYWSKKCEFMQGKVYWGWPDKEKPFDPWVWDDAHANCPGPGAVHSGYATRYTTDMFARAYSVTRDPEWLRWAKKAWNRGSKRGYQTTSQFAPDGEVGQFAYIRGSHHNEMTECSVRMFYEVPRTE